MTASETLLSRLKEFVETRATGENPMTRSAIASELGISERHLNNLLKGERPPGKQAWQTIARALNWNPADEGKRAAGYQTLPDTRQRTPDQLFVVVPTLQNSPFWTGYIAAIMSKASTIEAPRRSRKLQEPPFGTTTFIHGESCARLLAFLDFIIRHRTRAVGLIVAAPQDVTPDERTWIPEIEEALTRLQAHGVPVLRADRPMPEPSAPAAEAEGGADQDPARDRLHMLVKIGPLHRQMGRTAAEMVLRYIGSYHRDFEAFILGDHLGPEMARIQGIADALGATIVDQRDHTLARAATQLQVGPSKESTGRGVERKIFAAIGHHDQGSDQPDDPNYRGFQDCINDLILKLVRSSAEVKIVFCTTSFFANRLHQKLNENNLAGKAILISFDAAGGIEYLRPAITYFNYTPSALAERSLAAITALREDPNVGVHWWDVVPALQGLEILMPKAEDLLIRS